MSSAASDYSHRWDKLLSQKRLRFLIEKKDPPPSSDGDLRTEFEKDHGRAIFSAPFRRLQDKTQVFPLDPGDIVRTRLTHSMEVSSIARSLGAAISTWLLERKDINSIASARGIEFICSTCGLLHDLGNPPFGHPGEKAIAAWVEKSSILPTIGDSTIKLDRPPRMSRALKGDFEHFNGNAQTFRLVTKLQILADFYGLNLTAGTLAALLKYTAGSSSIDESVHERSKLGYFQSEAETAELVWKEVGLSPHQRHPLTYLVEAADDIAYSAVDVEDAIRKGVIDWAFFKRSMEVHGKAQASFDYIDKYISDNEVRGGIPSDIRNQGEVSIQLFRTHSIIHHTALALQSFKDHYNEIMEGRFHGELLFDDERGKLGFVKELKSFARDNIWHTRENVKLEILGTHIINGLMDVFADAEPTFKDFPSRRLDLTDYKSKLYTVMSTNYRRVYEYYHNMENRPIDSRYLRLQLITDYICGMSDGFAVNLYNELRGFKS